MRFPRWAVVNVCDGDAMKVLYMSPIVSLTMSLEVDTCRGQPQRLPMDVRIFHSAFSACVEFVPMQPLLYRVDFSGISTRTFGANAAMFLA